MSISAWQLEGCIVVRILLFTWHTAASAEGIRFVRQSEHLTGDGCAVHCTLRAAGGPIMRGL